MAYTVKQVAAMSGVSVRTLHFYDETGLLKPAYLGANGYRFYEEPQLLTLQQILFYRELGFELKQIKRILGRSDFDKVAALESHRKVLRKNLARTRKLIADHRQNHRALERNKENEESGNVCGLRPGAAGEARAISDRPLRRRGMKEGIEQSKQRVKDWTKADWEKSGSAFNAICQDLVSIMGRQLPPDSPDAQDDHPPPLRMAEAILDANEGILRRPQP